MEQEMEPEHQNRTVNTGLRIIDGYMKANDYLLDYDDDNDTIVAHYETNDEFMRYTYPASKYPRKIDITIGMNMLRIPLLGPDYEVDIPDYCDIADYVRAKGYFPEIENINDINVQQLVFAKIEPNQKYGEAGQTLLHYAARRNNLNMVKYLVEHEADVNMIDDNEATPLRYSVCKSNSDILKYLVEAGANVNVADNCKLTPLHLAAMCGNYESVKYLIKHGADIHATAHEEVYYNRDALQIAVRYKGEHFDKQKQKHDDYNREKIIKYLLINGANKRHAGTDGKTAEDISRNIAKKIAEDIARNIKKFETDHVEATQREFDMADYIKSFEPDLSNEDMRNE